MPGFRPLGTAALGTPESTDLRANPGTLTLSTIATFTTLVSMLGSSAVSFASTSAALTTGISLACASTVPVSSDSATLSTRQDIASVGERIAITASGASLTPLTQISAASVVQLTTAPPTLITRDADRASAALSITSNFAVLTTRIPLFSSSPVSITSNDGSAVLVTRIALKSTGSSAAAVSIRDINPFGDRAMLQLGGTKLYATSGEFGSEPGGFDAMVRFTTTANLVSKANLASSLAEVRITSSVNLLTSFDLAAASTISISTASPLISGINLFSEREATAVVGITSTARLTVPHPGTVMPEGALRIRGRVMYRLGGHDYSTIKMAA